MDSRIVFLVYTASFLLAVFLLWRYTAPRWYWHVASVIIALGIGLMPPRGDFSGPIYDMTVGALFIFFFVWGAGIVVERIAHHTWFHFRHGSGHHA